MKKSLTLVFLISLSFLGFSQRNGPMEEPCGAINLGCSPYYHTDDPFSGSITFPAIPGCYKSGNTWYNPVFLRFKATKNGYFNFTITPNTTYSDYDYWVFDISTSPDACETIMQNIGPTWYWCNTYTSYGATGNNLTDASQTCSSPSQCAFSNQLFIQGGKEYLILISYYNDGLVTNIDNLGEGFTFDATNSTPGLFATDVNYTVSSNKSTVCIGSSALLSINSTEKDVQYTWTAPGMTSQTGTSITVSPTVTTTYTVSALKKGSTCAPTVKTITINVAQPTPITLSSSKTRICQGETITLTANGAPSGSTYVFSGVGLGTPSGNTVVATPSITNTYGAQYTNTFGCVSTASVPVQVDFPLNFTATTSKNTICAGSSVTLQTNTFSSNGTYVWNGGLLNNAAGATQVVTPTVSTVYTLVASDALSVCTTTSQVKVNVVDQGAITITDNVNTCGSGELCAQVPAVKLMPGDIALLRYRMDPTYEFTFVNLVPIPQGTVINFTDGAWNANTQQLVLGAGDKTVSYTATTTLPAGSSVTLGGAGYNWDFSSAGDQIIVYQGAQSNPEFIYALSTNLWIKSGTPTVANSYLPKGLINGQSAIEFKLRRKNGKFSSTFNYTGTSANLLFQLSNQNNWTISNILTFPVTGSTPVGDPSIWNFNITDAVIAGVKWNNNAITSCINVSSDGVYEVTYTEPHGCTVSAQKNITSSKDVNWATYLGVDQAPATFVNSANNIVLCGVLSNQVFPTNSNTTFITNGSGNYGVYIAELNSDGSQIVKLIQYKMSELQFPLSEVTNLIIGGVGNYFIAGNISSSPSSGFVLRLNSNGQFAWQKNLDFKVYDADFISGKVALVGHNNSGTTADFRCMYINNNGVTIFDKTLGGNSHDVGLSITHDEVGNFYVAGMMVNSSITNSELLTTEVNNNNVLGAEDGVIYKISPTGNLLKWTRLGSNQYDYLRGIAWKNNKIYAVGTKKVDGSLKFTEWLTVLNDQSLQVVQELYDENGSVSLYDVMVSSTNQLWVSGYTAYESSIMGSSPYRSFSGTTSGFDYDLVALKLNINTLSTEWSTYWGSATNNTNQNESPFSMSIDANNAIYLSGRSDGTQFNVKNNAAGTILKNTSNGVDGVLLKISCENTSSGQGARTSMAELESSSNKKWEVYPTFFSDALHVSFLSRKEGAVQVVVYSSDGKQIHESEYASNQEITLGNTWSEGIYFMRISDREKTEVVKVVKK